MVTTIPPWLAAIFVGVTFIITVLFRSLRAPNNGRESLKPVEANEKAEAGSLNLKLKPIVATSVVVPPFDFRKEPPRAYRPFKTRTHVAMGIEKVPQSDWIQMDWGYLDRLNERVPVMEKNPQWTIGVNEISAPAILELFKEVMIDHVPKHFPSMFRLDGDILTNLITQQTFDVERASKDPHLALRTLCRNVEEDFYLMCPDGQGDWRLQGYISCFPGGFDGPSRVGMSFRDIHLPVPHYEERIANGVDKFVRRMKVDGQLVQRFNWSLQCDGKDLWRLDGNNFYPEKGHTLPNEAKRIDIDQSWLRYERQTLKVLPETGAIVFCVRLYMTSLRDIVREGNGIELADAIDSMPEKLGLYKMRPFWEEDVMAFLRGTV
ncbi:hypothetical protein N7495_001615 [Penicillium taxi]|uniref:uncharacterized protein n=1 Tax=Penicillium taxi TaxID=168475 RepID=UPI002544EF46|nr:uncharacterized protein N7495_001615 [Penicillium taxi]KAJ5908933.1 hypothetical protein N7495_001615 [Penicillium taxi]